MCKLFLLFRLQAAPANFIGKGKKTKGQGIKDDDNESISSITYDIPEESLNKAIEILPVMAQTLKNKGKKVKTFESFNDSTTTNFEAPLPVADNFNDSYHRLHYQPHPHHQPHLTKSNTPKTINMTNAALAANQL